LRDFYQVLPQKSRRVVSVPGGGEIRRALRSKKQASGPALHSRRQTPVLRLFG